jgi:DNA-directed RNA polymerase II subunit RPB2
MEYRQKVWQAVDLYFRDQKYFVTDHHLRSYDDFIERGLAETVRSMNPVTLLLDDSATKKKHGVFLHVGSKTVYADKPTIVDASGTTRPLFPNEARLKDLTYAINVYADVKVHYTVDSVEVGEPMELERPVLIGRIPIMLHSKMCYLHGMPTDALREMGECQNDQGGYFIVDGREKVIIAREEHVGNRLYVREAEASNKDVSHLAWIRCFRLDKKDVFPRTATFKVRSAVAKNPRAIWVTVTHVEPAIPLFVLFRALGVESDRAIMQNIVYDLDAPDEQDVVEFLRACVLEAADRGVFDQRSAIEALKPLTDFGTEASLRYTLTYDLFPNIPADFAVKAMYLGHLTRSIVRAVLKKDPILVRDDYSNVRLQLSGFMLSDLFRDVYLRLHENMRRALTTEFYSGTWRNRGDIRSLVTPLNVKNVVPPYIITENLQKAFKGKWGVDDEASADDVEEGVVQDLNRVSYLAYVSHVRRVNNPLDRSVKLSDPHKMLASHWGAVCPVESPDGPNIGLIKHLAVLSHVTIDADHVALFENLIESKLAMELRPFVTRLHELRGACKVFVNNTWMAVTVDPPGLVAHVRTMRRGGVISREISVSWNVFKNEVYIHTDRGRCCRPLVRVEARKTLLSQGTFAWESWAELFCAGTTATGKLPLPSDAKVIARLKAAAGPLEMVDVEELLTLLVAMGTDYIARYPMNAYTHCELHPATILSLVTATYPMLNHNNAAYNVFCLAQFKQAVGTFCTSFNARMDTMASLLHYPQRPVVSTRFADKLCHGQLAHGENLIVAVGSYTGYNQEDSILLNLDSVERGRFNLTYFKTSKFEEKTPRFAGQEVAVAFANPLRLAAEGREVSGIRADGRYEKIGPEGLPVHDAFVGEDDVLLGLVHVSNSQPQADEGDGKPASAYADRSVIAGRAHSGVVDRVFPYRGPDGRCVKVRMRQVRTPELGDKLGSRFGQKGVVGMLLRSQDMPFCHESGIVPDLILNPNAFPKRMTVTHLLECLLAKAGSVTGRRHNVNTFDPVDVVAEAAAALSAHGLHEHGDEVMYNGKTGEQVATKVFIGVNYYGRFKHMVQDKYQYRVKGKVAAVTRQPAKTPDGSSGGLRLGEMERDVLLTHGITSFLKESFMDRSDRCRVIVDTEQGTLAHTADQRAQRYTAAAKGDDRDTYPSSYAAVEMPYAFKLLQQELQAMSIGTRLSDTTHDEAAPLDALQDSESDDNDQEGAAAEGGDDRPWEYAKDPGFEDEAMEDDDSIDALEGDVGYDSGGD